MKKYLARSKNGIRVYVDLENSHAATHMTEEPKLIEALKEAIPKLALKGDHVATEVEMGHIVGKTSLVETTAKDEIIFAKRLNRTNYTRFVKNREPSDCSKITLILKLSSSQKSYDLFSAWVGFLTPTFPDSEFKTPGSLEFWESHALVWGREPIQSSTVTTTQPW